MFFASFSYESLNELAPEYMRNLFTRCSESNGRVVRSTDTDLKLPLLKTRASQKLFSYRGERPDFEAACVGKQKWHPPFRQLSKDDINTLSQS